MKRPHLDYRHSLHTLISFGIVGLLALTFVTHSVKRGTDEALSKIEDIVLAIRAVAGELKERVA